MGVRGLCRDYRVPLKRGILVIVGCITFRGWVLDKLDRSIGAIVGCIGLGLRISSLRFRVALGTQRLSTMTSGSCYPVFCCCSPVLS